MSDIGDAVARHPEIAAEAGDRAGDRKGDELLARDVDAAIARRHRISADRIEARGLRRDDEENPSAIATATAIQDTAGKAQELGFRGRQESGAHIRCGEPGCRRAMRRSRRDRSPACPASRRSAECRRSPTKAPLNSAEDGAETRRRAHDGEDRQARMRHALTRPATMPVSAKFAATERSMPRVSSTPICAERKHEQKACVVEQRRAGCRRSTNAGARNPTPTTSASDDERPEGYRDGAGVIHAASRAWPGGRARRSLPRSPRRVRIARRCGPRA